MPKKLTRKLLSSCSWEILTCKARDTKIQRSRNPPEPEQPALPDSTQLPLTRPLLPSTSPHPPTLSRPSPSWVLSLSFLHSLDNLHGFSTPPTLKHPDQALESASAQWLRPLTSSIPSTTSSLRLQNAAFKFPSGWTGSASCTSAEALVWRARSKLWV